VAAKKARNSDISEPLAELAEQLIKDAIMGEPEQRLEIFKVLTQYYIGCTKVDVKSKQEGKNELFSSFKQQVADSGE